MPIIHHDATVAYTAMELFTLVDAVEDYPLFLPWCHASEVFLRNEHEVQASLTLSKNGIQKSFTTHNLRQPGKMIEIRLLSGPFRHLHGFWRFETLNTSECKISLDLEFEFNNKLIALALTPLFQHVGDTLVDAFHQRAIEIYGKK